jgi:hypothetical protein
LIESAATSSYHAGILQGTIRGGNSVQLDASYTFSRAIDTAPDATAFIPNSSSEDPKLVEDTLNPDADRGLSEAHAGHRLVVSGIWDIDGFGGTESSALRSLTRAWQLAVILGVQSGRWFSARTNVDLNNDSNRFSDRAPGFSRNTVRGPMFASLDLRVSKTVSLARASQVRLIVEGFNILNRANVSAIQQVAYTYDAAARVFTPNPTFGAATNTSDPRVLQIAARFTF